MPVMDQKERAGRDLKATSERKKVRNEISYSSHGNKGASYQTCRWQVGVVQGEGSAYGE